MNTVVRRIVTALATATLVAVALVYAPFPLIAAVLCALAALSLVECAQLVRRRLAPPRAAYWKMFLPAAAIVLTALAALAYIAYRFGNVTLLYIIAIVKLSDMGGFAFGLSAKRLFGDTRKLCPTISPNKSWEGLLGSLIGATLMSLVFMPWTHFAPSKAVALGIVAALVGTFGDLVESKFKRWAGVKDSATFMPAGLGGFLDMIDSLLIAPTLLMLFL